MFVYKEPGLRLILLSGGGSYAGSILRMLASASLSSSHVPTKPESARYSKRLSLVALEATTLSPEFFYSSTVVVLFYILLKRLKY